MVNKTKITAEPSKQEIIIIRDFDAPREMVFEAFTDPELLVQWMGQGCMTMHIDFRDSRSGGSYRYVYADANGNEFGFHGCVHEVTKPERLIQTFEFEGLPEKGHVSLETSVFESLPGNKTRATIQLVFRSVADRDGMVMSGMETGVTESYERLDELLETKA